MDNHTKTLSKFLNVPIDSGDEIIKCFLTIPGAISGCGSKSFERYVYIPGYRKDRIVLVAHIDTIWDNGYNNNIPSGKQEVVFSNGIFHGSNPACGIGADDRAGCAMLWELRNSGHSLLIVDGEEYGKLGAKYLKISNRKLFRELNKHHFMIELDSTGTDCCLFNQVDNTKRFKKYIEEELGFIDSKTRGGTDLQVLCHKVCGVNLGIGYHNQHINKEFLRLSEWENTLTKLSLFLEKKQKRYRTSISIKCIRFAKRCTNKVMRILKLK